MLELNILLLNIYIPFVRKPGSLTSPPGGTIAKCWNSLKSPCLYLSLRLNVVKLSLFFCLLTEISPSYMPAHIFSLVFSTFLIPESSFAYFRRTTSGFLISCKWLPASGASLDLQPPLLCELSEVQGYLHLCLWWGELALGDFMQNKKNPCCSLLWNFMSTFILWLTKNPLHLHFIPQSQHDGALPLSKQPL